MGAGLAPTAARPAGPGPRRRRAGVERHVDRDVAVAGVVHPLERRRTAVVDRVLTRGRRRRALPASSRGANRSTTDSYRLLQPSRNSMSTSPTSPKVASASPTRSSTRSVEPPRLSKASPRHCRLRRLDPGRDHPHPPAESSCSRSRIRAFAGGSAASPSRHSSASTRVTSSLRKVLLGDVPSRVVPARQVDVARTRAVGLLVEVDEEVRIERVRPVAWRSSLVS